MVHLTKSRPIQVRFIILDLAIFFLLLRYTNAQHRVNGINYHEMGTYFRGVEDRVFYMQMDLFLSNHLLFTDGCALKTLDMKFRQSYVIGGSSLNCTYEEGSGSEARFTLLTSFEQLNRTHLLLTDHKNHCVRLINRLSNSSSTYAGNCTEEGIDNGLLLEARFSWPDEMTSSPDPSVIYICDGKSIREINIKHGTVVPFIDMGYIPIALALDSTSTSLYVSTRTRITKFDTQSKIPEPLSTSTTSGWRDGILRQALFNSLLNFIFLRADTILGVDSQNNRLRIIDLENSSVTSICNGRNISRDGDSQTCQIPGPYSVLALEDQSVILIGGERVIRSLAVSGSLQLNSRMVFNNTTSGNNGGSGTNATTDIAIANDAAPIAIWIIAVAIVAAVTAIAIIVGVVLINKIRKCCKGCYRNDAKNHYAHYHKDSKQSKGKHVYEKPYVSNYSYPDSYAVPFADNSPPGTRSKFQGNKQRPALPTPPPPTSPPPALTPPPDNHDYAYVDEVPRKARLKITASTVRKEGGSDQFSGYVENPELAYESIKA